MNNDRGSFRNFNNSNSGFNPFNSKRGGFGRGGGRGPFRGGRKNFRGSFPSRGFRGGNRPQDNYGNRNQNQQWNKPQRDSPGKRLSEEDIGVTEYLSDHAGFNGVIKSRYADFQVSEINEQGEIAKLTDLTPPTAKEEDVDDDEDLLLCKYNLEILPMETWDQINKLATSTDHNDEKVEVDVTGMSKEQRTKIHDAVKKAFGDVIVGSTVTVDDKKFVKFDKFRKGVRVDNRVKWMWPGEYVYFVVHKENCDTMDAAARIAERLKLNIKPSMLGYAGTKDRRAKTSQWFSLRKVDPRRVAAATKQLWDIRVGNYSFSPHNLRLGMLKGNRFRIALRNVTESDEAVAVACSRLRERGFINYYGLQRFGTRIETPTYNIGLKLLQGNFKEAIASVLEEREGPLQHALRVYRDQGAAAALRVWPRRVRGDTIEARMVKALAKEPNDLLGALNKLARNTRLLYLHSYQSLVWNRAVSQRLRTLGLAPAVGDIVPLDTVHNEEEVREDESDNEDDAETDSEVQDEKSNESAEKAEDDNKTVTSSKDKKDTSIKQVKQKIPVKILTQEDVDSGKYSIFDVVMPLPGYMVEYPPNIKDYYEELLTKDGLNLQMSHKIKSYSMSGAYRHVAIRPLDVEWSTVRYSDPYCDLILSDWDQIRGKQLTGIIENGKFKALLLNMTLPPSCYATMALRELLKADTSCDNQASLNNYYKQKGKTEEKSEGNGECENGEKETKIEQTTTEETKAEEAKLEETKLEETKLGETTLEETEMEEESQGEKRKLDSSDEVDVKKLKKEDQ